MIKDLPQFVSQDVCLSCDGCCRFSEENSSWRPKVGQEEVGERCRREIGDDGYIKAIESQGQVYCVFFEAKDNTCAVYQHRPFECRLYPFLLMKRGDGVAIGAHLSCPHVQEKRNSEEFNVTVEGLQKYFQKTEVIAFIQRNRFLPGDYSACEQEVEYLFQLAC